MFKLSNTADAKASQKLVAIDFFSSVGGVTCGFKQAGIAVLGGIDIDHTCKETYERNNNAKFLCADVSKLEKDSLKKEFGIKKNQPNLIFIGCSPCQYYSNIKTDKSKSKEGRLLLADFQEFVEYYSPGYVFIENVAGLERDPDSPLGKFKTMLRAKGYYFDEGVLNAKYYGVPQNRRRYVLIASKLRELKLPIPEKSAIKSVRDAIGDTTKFPPIKAGERDKSDHLHAAAKLSELNFKRLKITPLNGGDRRDWEYLAEFASDNYNGSHYDKYGRMCWDKPSPTITTRFNSLSNGRYGHPEQHRAISLREGATLQTFPLNYTFYSNNQGIISKQIGNAVPPLMAKAIAEVLK